MESAEVNPFTGKVAGDLSCFLTAWKNGCVFLGCAFGFVVFVLLLFGIHAHSSRYEKSEAYMDFSSLKNSLLIPSIISNCLII